MTERRLVILKHIGRSPTLAACEKCQLKFFVPWDLVNYPTKADEHLRQKYLEHRCRTLEGPRPN